MTARRLPLLLAALAVAGLTLAGSAATAPPPPPPDPTCSPGPANCFAWHTSNVTVTWSSPPPGVTACPAARPRSPATPAAAPVSCTWSNAEGSKTTTANVRRDATPPSVRGSAERGADANGWYTRGVKIEFSGSDALSGISAPARPASYSGPDSGAARISGTCTDGAGNAGSTTVRGQVRRDAADGRGEGRAATGRERLVQPRGQGRVRRHGHGLRCRYVRPAGRVQGTRYPESRAVRHLP